MADAPSPITSPPAQDFQPWDATAPGRDDTAPTDNNVYRGNSDWVKIKDAGSINMTTGAVAGGWPDDGTSDGSAWTQC